MRGCAAIVVVALAMALCACQRQRTEEAEVAAPSSPAAVKPADIARARAPKDEIALFEARNNFEKRIDEGNPIKLDEELAQQRKVWCLIVSNLRHAQAWYGVVSSIEDDRVSIELEEGLRVVAFYKHGDALYKYIRNLSGTEVPVRIDADFVGVDDTDPKNAFGPTCFEQVGGGCQIKIRSVSEVRGG